MLDSQNANPTYQSGEINPKKATKLGFIKGKGKGKR